MMYTWEEIENFVNHCRRCPLAEIRTNAVMGKGSHNAQIMFIGEAPGAQEDLVGIPFVGPAGQLFDKLLNECGLRRHDVYVTNIVKCRPTNNRDPRENEKERCFPYLCYETTLLKPKIIVCLGRVAATKLIDPNYKITQMHGQWIERKGYYLTSTYHPSAVLRDPTKMDAAKNDFRIIVDKLNEINHHDNA